MKKQRLAKVSPWVLAAACTLLTLIIGVFAVNNYRREKMLMTEALIQQGATIARFVMAGSVASLKGNRRNIHIAMSNWTDHVQQAIDNTSAQPGMKFLGLIDDEGVILACSDRGKVGDKLNNSSLKFIKRFQKQSIDSGSHRITGVRDGSEPAFQMVNIFYPFGFRNIVPKQLRHGFIPRGFGDDTRGAQGRMMRKLREQITDFDSGKYTLLIELDLSGFNRAVRRQLLQILSLSIALLLVGVGGWLSLLTLQGLKGSQTQLRRISEFTDVLISSLPIGLIATDNDGNLRIVNDSAQDMTGIEGSFVIGKDPREVLPPELSNVLRKKSRGNDVVSQHEITLIDPEMKPRSLLLVALPVLDSKKMYVGNTLLIQDLSQVKDLQREVRRNERLAALGKMAAGVAHELRNPLSSIKGLAVLLKSRLGSDKKGVDTADILVHEVERLNRSISELLDYARPQKLRKEKTNISEVLNKSVSLVLADIEAEKIKLETDYCENELIVHGDKDKLNQVFLNLLLNSIQAVTNGGVLRVKTRVENDLITCIIEDNGCGLEIENISKVFDPYFTTKSDGTGLGLAMSAKIIEEHGGTIEFKSQLDSGTVVSVTLPSFSE